MQKRPTLKEVIAMLNLKPLPEEGGFYAETYRSKISVGSDGGPRSVSTAIFYLLTATDFSALHRLKHDEIFHFYQGDSVQMLFIQPNGEGRKVVLGADLLNGDLPQVTVPAGVWQGSRINKVNLGWSLLGTTMAPGFDFADFELGDRDALTATCPQYAQEIEQLTKGH